MNGKIKLTNCRLLKLPDTLEMIIQLISCLIYHLTALNRGEIAWQKEL